jgi:hypothetical protein
MYPASCHIRLFGKSPDCVFQRESGKYPVAHKNKLHEPQKIIAEETQGDCCNVG